MTMQSWIEGDFLQQQNVLVLGAGLVVALAVFLVCSIVFLRRPKPRSFEGPPPSKNGEPVPDPYIHGSFGDKRETLRRKGKFLKVAVAADMDGREELGIGWVIDRSMGGLCLQIEQAQEAGTLLSVRPLEAPISTPWVQVEVKTCREADGHWEIGCQFVKTPTYNVLLLFG